LAPFQGLPFQGLPFQGLEPLPMLAARVSHWERMNREAPQPAVTVQEPQTVAQAELLRVPLRMAAMTGS
jgi:hypothetical protein